jgi:hypothetical protein
VRVDLEVESARLRQLDVHLVVADLGHVDADPPVEVEARRQVRGHDVEHVQVGAGLVHTSSVTNERRARPPAVRA